MKSCCLRLYVEEGNKVFPSALHTYLHLKINLSLPKQQYNTIGGAMENFPERAQLRPEGPRISAEASRAEAGVHGKGCPLPWVRNFFILEPLQTRF